MLNMHMAHKAQAATMWHRRAHAQLPTCHPGKAILVSEMETLDAMEGVVRAERENTEAAL